jgi:D-sedoheptulose 7-phosphate isomerase
MGLESSGLSAKAMASGHSKGYLENLIELLTSFPHDQFERVVAAIMQAYEADRRIFVMGNGGSGATASHLACDLNKGACFGVEKKFKVLCLNDSIPAMTAYANDISFRDIFVRQMLNFFRPGDVAMGISTSGNSENILEAVGYAAGNGGHTIGLCGFQGGKLSKAVDISLVVGSSDVQQIEDIHCIVAHMLTQALMLEVCQKDGP